MEVEITRAETVDKHQAAAPSVVLAHQQIAAAVVSQDYLVRNQPSERLASSISLITCSRDRLPPRTASNSSGDGLPSGS